MLYRRGKVDIARVDDGEQATASVVISSFLDIGLQRIVGESPALINAAHEFLVSCAALALPRVLAYERGEWAQSQQHSCGVVDDELADFYAKSVQCADNVIAQSHQ